MVKRYFKVQCGKCGIDLDVDIDDKYQGIEFGDVCDIQVPVNTSVILNVKSEDSSLLKTKNVSVSMSGSPNIFNYELEN